MAKGEALSKEMAKMWLQLYKGLHNLNGEYEWLGETLPLYLTVEVLKDVSFALYLQRTNDTYYVPDFDQIRLCETVFNRKPIRFDANGNELTQLFTGNIRIQ